jgi:hypothetical protein
VNATRLARLAAGALSIVVLAASGVYLVLYLYRWEWNRAQISGIFFIAALTTVSTGLVLRTIHRLDARIDRLERRTPGTGMVPDAGAEPGANAETLAILQAANRGRPTQRFAWLVRPPRGPTVFVPVLLGAGVILSFVAYVIEHLAGWLAGPAADRTSALLLAQDLPLGGRLDRPAAPPPDGAGPRRGTVGTRAAGWIVVLAVAAIAVVTAIDQIGDATQSRPERSAAPGRHALLLTIDQRRDARPAAVLAEALTVACRNRLPDGVGVDRIEAIDGPTVLVVLDHRIGELTERRFVGCLEDATLDLTIAEVRVP